MKVFLNCLDHGMVQSKVLLMFSHPDYVRPGKHSHVNAEVSVWVSHSFSYVSCYTTAFIFTRYLQVALLTSSLYLKHVKHTKDNKCTNAFIILHLTFYC